MKTQSVKAETTFQEVASEYFSHPNATEKLNRWLRENTVQIINIETIMETTGQIRMAGSVDTRAAGIILWYHVAKAQPEQRKNPLDEVNQKLATVLEKARSRAKEGKTNH